ASGSLHAIQADVPIQAPVIPLPRPQSPYLALPRCPSWFGDALQRLATQTIIAGTGREVTERDNADQVLAFVDDWQTADLALLHQLYGLLDRVVLGCPGDVWGHDIAYGGQTRVAPLGDGAERDVAIG